MWKPVKGVGYVVRSFSLRSRSRALVSSRMLTRTTASVQLYHCKTRREIARPVQEMVTEGFFRGQKKFCLAIEPTTLDIDVVVLSFLIMEKRRRERVTAESMKIRHQDEDTTAEGGCEAEMTGSVQ